VWVQAGHGEKGRIGSTSAKVSLTEVVIGGPGAGRSGLAAEAAAAAAAAAAGSTVPWQVVEGPSLLVEGEASVEGCEARGAVRVAGAYGTQGYLLL